jgi:hypothetical protein
MHHLPNFLVGFPDVLVQAANALELLKPVGMALRFRNPFWRQPTFPALGACFSSGDWSAPNCA